MFETGRCQSEEGADGLSVMGFGCGDDLGSYDGVDGVDGTREH